MTWVAVRRFASLLVLLVFTLEAGCGSIVNLAEGPWIHAKRVATVPYGGVILDAEAIAYPFVAPSTPTSSTIGQVMVLFGGIIDLPFCIVIDTLTLPYTIPKALSGPPSETRTNPPQVRGVTVEEDNPEFHSWESWSLNSWRKFKVISLTGIREYADRLLGLNPHFALLERTLGEDKWTVKVFARLTSTVGVEQDRLHGDEQLQIGTEQIVCHWVRKGTGGTLEKIWYTPKVPGGWAMKHRQGPGIESLEKEIIFEYGSGD